jgi:hypothetical protein
VRWGFAPSGESRAQSLYDHGVSRGRLLAHERRSEAGRKPLHVHFLFHGKGHAVELAERRTARPPFRACERLVPRSLLCVANERSLARLSFGELTRSCNRARDERHGVRSAVAICRRDLAHRARPARCSPELELERRPRMVHAGAPRLEPERYPTTGIPAQSPYRVDAELRPHDPGERFLERSLPGESRNARERSAGDASNGEAERHGAAQASSFGM